MTVALLPGEHPIRAPRHLDPKRPSDIGRMTTATLITLIAAWMVKHAQTCSVSARFCLSRHHAPRYVQQMMYEVSYRLGGIRAMESVRVKVAQFTLAVGR